MITVTISLRGESLDVGVATPDGEPPVAYVRLDYGNSTVQSRDPAALEALAASVLEAASRLRAARDVYDTQQQAGAA